MVAGKPLQESISNSLWRAAKKNTPAYNHPLIDTHASMKGDRILLSVIGLGVFAAVVALAFTGYVSPAMLIDFANIRICS
jgi:hypothetical protein